MTTSLRVTHHEWFGGFEIHLHVEKNGVKGEFAADVGGDPLSGSAITYFWHISGPLALMDDVEDRAMMTRYVKQQIRESVRSDDRPARFLTNGAVLTANRVVSRSRALCT